MLVCLGDEGLNLAAIEDWKWIEATKELSVTFPMNRVKTYRADAAVALRRALKGNGPLSLAVVHLLPANPSGRDDGGSEPASRPEPARRVDAVHETASGSSPPYRPVAVVEGTLNT
jgi:hypothetical protein